MVSSFKSHEIVLPKLQVTKEVRGSRFSRINSILSSRLLAICGLVLIFLLPLSMFSASVAEAIASQTETTNAPRSQTSYTYHLPFLANTYTRTGTIGSFTTYLAIQNTSSTIANITIVYHDSNANVLPTPPTSCASVNPLAECIASNPFAMGKRGTGIVTSDQPLSIIVGESTPFGGTAYTANAVPSNVNVVPIAFNDAFGGFNAQLTIFNPGIGSGASINFYDKNGSVIASKYVPIRSATNQILDLNDPTLGLPNGFAGWALILAGPEIGDELVVQTLEYNLSHHFVAVLDQYFLILLFMLPLSSIKLLAAM